jgi:hypothetical protein
LSLSEIELSIFFIELFRSIIQLFRLISKDSDCSIEACFSQTVALYQSIAVLGKIVEVIELFNTSVTSESIFLTLTISESVLSKSFKYVQSLV